MFGPIAVVIALAAGPCPPSPHQCPQGCQKVSSHSCRGSTHSWEPSHPRRRRGLDAAACSSLQATCAWCLSRQRLWNKSRPKPPLFCCSDDNDVILRSVRHAVVIASWVSGQGAMQTAFHHSQLTHLRRYEMHQDGLWRISNDNV